MGKIFGIFASLFGYFLNYIYSLVNNYGIAIIIFTIALKILMLPISIKQQKAMKISVKMQQKVKEIQLKYSNDQVRQSQELIDLYKREKVSPLNGCLTSIIQFLIVISMFCLVSQPLTFMKHLDKNAIDSYYEQLSQETKDKIRYREIAIIKELATKDENVNVNMNFLGLDLSDTPSQELNNWKVYIIPVLYVFTSFISTKIVTNMNKSVNSDEENKSLVKVNEEEKDIDAMEEMNKQMNLMMPLMSVSIAMIAPLGLALYWLISNLVMIAERIIVNKLCKEEEENNG